MTKRLSMLVLTAALARAGCGDDDATGSPDAGGVDAGGRDAGAMDAGSDDAGAMDAGDGDAGSMDAGNMPTEPRLFMTFGFSFSPEGLSTVIATTDALDEVPTSEEALVIPGFAGFFAEGDSLYLARPDSATITRYALPEAGSFIEGESVSFMGRGVTQLSGESTFVALDGDAGYVFDLDLGEIILWDAAAMEITGSVAIPGIEALTPPEGQTVRGNGITVVENQVQVSFRYEEAEIQLPRTAFVFYDTVTGEASVHITELCGASFTSVASSGDAYYATNLRGASDFELGRRGSFEPCMIRVRAGETVVDESFTLTLSDLAPGVVGGLLSGPGESAYVFAYDETIEPIGEEDFSNVSAWRLYAIPELGGTTEGTRVEGLPPVNGGTAFFEIGGVAYLAIANPDFGGSVVWDLSDPSGAAQLWETSGFLVGQVVGVE
ncbi:MAG: hypothetical protein AAGH15_22405 [Myxococcota bacterium]